MTACRDSTADSSVQIVRMSIRDRAYVNYELISRYPSKLTHMVMDICSLLLPLRAVCGPRARGRRGARRAPPRYLGIQNGLKKSSLCIPVPVLQSTLHTTCTARLVGSSGRPFGFLVQRAWWLAQSFSYAQSGTRRVSVAPRRACMCRNPSRKPHAVQTVSQIRPPAARHSRAHTRPATDGTSASPQGLGRHTHTRSGHRPAGHLRCSRGIPRWRYDTQTTSLLLLSVPYSVSERLGSPTPPPLHFFPQTHTCSRSLDRPCKITRR